MKFIVIMVLQLISFTLYSQTVMNNTLHKSQKHFWQMAEGIDKSSFEINLFELKHLLSQNKYVSDTLKNSSSNITIFLGIHINNFNKPLLGLSYETVIKPNLVRSYEVQSFSIQKPNYFVTISSSLKYYFLKIKLTKFYLQGGAGFVITYPAPFLFGSFGVSYWEVFFEVKSFIAEEIPTFLSIGIKF